MKRERAKNVPDPVSFSGTYEILDGGMKVKCGWRENEKKHLDRINGINRIYTKKNG
jgi:hypothetical protein